MLRVIDFMKTAEFLWVSISRPGEWCHDHKYHEYDAIVIVQIYCNLTNNARFLKICSLSFHANSMKASVGYQINTYFISECAE